MEKVSRAKLAGDQRRRPTGRADETSLEFLDTNCEVATVLLSRRWERRDRPFQGFDSPPGKF